MVSKNFRQAVCLLIFLGIQNQAFGLPAFALREKMSCVVCHAGGSVAHLTKAGYLYRRAGFRWPTEIGNREKDDRSMEITHHLAAGINVDYEFATQSPGGGSRQAITSNQFNVPEVEIWPIVGSFLGNYSAWSEVDLSPSTVAHPGEAPGGEVFLSQAELKYTGGNADHYWAFRFGMMNNEGFGASDQWIDDANVPLFDRATAQYNQETFATPFGAMEQPELGAEFQFNYDESHLTLGVYNGFDASYAQPNAVPAVTPQLTAALMNRSGQNSKDYKIQVDQFVLDDSAITAAYYHGQISLLDPTMTTPWIDSYSNWRLYLTHQTVKGVVESLAGLAYDTNDWYDSNAGKIGGQFHSKGVFVGANYYVMPHLTLAGRVDFFQFNDSKELKAKANGYEFMVSMPFENSVFILHYNRTISDLASAPQEVTAGVSNDYRAEWRFLF